MRLRPLLLCALFFATPVLAVSADDGRLLTSLVASAAAKDARVDVVTAADLRAAVDLEADASRAGCDVTSCLAEVAAAMDAGAVLHGTIGTLGDNVVLNLSLFDSSTATSVGRASAKANDVTSIGNGVDAAVAEVLKNVAAVKDGKRVRVLVLDLEVLGNVAPVAVAVAEPGFPVLSGIGIGVAGLGVIGVVVAVGAELVAGDANGKLANKDTDATAVAGLVSTRADAANAGKIAWPVGAVLLIGGAALAAVPLMMGE